MHSLFRTSTIAHLTTSSHSLCCLRWDCALPWPWLNLRGSCYAMLESCNLYKRFSDPLLILHIRKQDWQIKQDLRSCSRWRGKEEASLLECYYSWRGADKMNNLKISISRVESYIRNTWPRLILLKFGCCWLWFMVNIKYDYTVLDDLQSKLTQLITDRVKPGQILFDLCSGSYCELQSF